MRNDLAAALIVAAGCLSPDLHAADLTVSVADFNGRPLQDAVVYLDGSPDLTKPAPQAHTTIDQINRQFVPLVTVLRTGTEVQFPNSDNIRHSIYSFSPAKTFTTKLYSGKQAPPIVFDKPGLVVLGCNIHDVMTAWVVVVDSNWFGKTGPDGAVILKGLGQGDYQLHVWYPGPAFDPVTSTVHLQSENLTQRIAVDSSASPLPALRARASAPAAGRQ